MEARRGKWPWVVVAVVSFAAACASEDENALFSKMIEMAQQGDPTAQYHAGMMLNNGIGTKKDPKAAFVWFGKAAAAGEPLASFKLGCYFGGQFGDVVTVDREKALQHHLIAAQAGYALAQGEVGDSFAEKGDFEEAVRWWKLAAAQGHGPTLYGLSIAHRDGKGVSKDPVLASFYLELSIKSSDRPVPEEYRSALERAKRALSAEETKAFEKMIATWKPNPTRLTTRASMGLEEAKKIAAASARK